MSLAAAIIPLSNAENRINLSKRTWQISKIIAGGAPRSPLGRPRNQNRLGRASVKRWYDLRYSGVLGVSLQEIVKEKRKL